jgi:hypothetical protein
MRYILVAYNNTDLEQILQKNWVQSRTAPEKGQRQTKDIVLWLMQRWISL